MVAAGLDSENQCAVGANERLPGAEPSRWTLYGWLVEYGASMGAERDVVLRDDTTGPCFQGQETAPPAARVL